MNRFITLILATTLILLTSNSAVPAEVIEPDNPEYVDTIRPLAEGGVAWAQAALGYFYHRGHLVPRNFQEARKWYLLAANQGEPKAMFGLGGMYEFGHGVDIDMSKAADWYRKSAEAGESAAQRKLGSLYHSGKGLPKDNIKAYFWLSIGFDDRDAAMIEILDKTKNEMTSTEIEKAERLLSKYKRKAL